MSTWCKRINNTSINVFSLIWIGYLKKGLLYVYFKGCCNPSEISIIIGAKFQVSFQYTSWFFNIWFVFIGLLLGSPLRSTQYQKWKITLGDEWNEFRMLSNDFEEEQQEPVVLSNPANHSRQLPPAYTPQQIEEETMRQFQLLKVKVYFFSYMVSSLQFLFLITFWLK